MSLLRDLFSDKERAGRPWSSGRIIAFATALTYNACLIRLATNGINIGWPWATLGVFILLAVPLQKLMATKHGPEIAAALIGRLGVGEVGGQRAPDPRMPNRKDDERGEPEQ